MVIAVAAAGIITVTLTSTGLVIALSGIITGVLLALARVMGETAPLLILVGVFLFLSRKQMRIGQIGRVLIGLGLIVLALELIVAAATPCCSERRTDSGLADRNRSVPNGATYGQVGSPAVNTGFSEVIGSWKIIATSAPRTSRI